MYTKKGLLSLFLFFILKIFYEIKTINYSIGIIKIFSSFFSDNFFFPKTKNETRTSMPVFISGKKKSDEYCCRVFTMDAELQFTIEVRRLNLKKKSNENNIYDFRFVGNW